MLRRGRFLGLRLCVVALASAAGCARPGVVPPSAAPAVTFVELGDTERELVTLSETAWVRLGIETTAVGVVAVAPGHVVVPYSSVIYDASGAAWAYEQVGERTFLRLALRIETIVGEDAILAEGPAVGSQVVSVGAAELYGAEMGVGGRH